MVIAHGIGTPFDDAQECALLGALELNAPVTALKGLTGYLGAATAITEMCIGIVSARQHAVPPVARLNEPDGDCALDLVFDAPRPLDAAAPLLLNVNWSWSGQCSAIAVRV
jgi:3-oxoacyl-(acyl-carrier-protein) synthase